MIKFAARLRGPGDEASSLQPYSTVHRAHGQSQLLVLTRVAHFAILGMFPGYVPATYL